MVQVHIDISVFTADEAIGMVSGPVEVAIPPQVGDVISFTGFVPAEAFVRENLPFGGLLRVTHRILSVGEKAIVQLALEDITASTRLEAERLMKLFEQHHQLFADFWKK